MNHRVQMCRHRAAIFRQLLGSPERNNRSPHLAASTNHPVGGRYLAKLMKGNPWWGEEGWGEEWRRDSWRGRRARPCGRGWLDGGLAPVGKFLSVKCVEPLDRTSFLGPHSSFFSSTLTLFPCSFGEADSSCNLFISFLLENLVSVSLRESSRERGNPFFSLSISWKAKSLLILLPLPPRLRLRGV